MSVHTDILHVGLAQISPVWLNRLKTTEKICSYIGKAAEAGCNLVVFGEALMPGYPFWIELTDGARFESDVQKDFHARYLQEAVNIARGDLDEIRQQCQRYSIATMVGTIERAMDRGGHSVYCSLVYIDAKGDIQSVHRKLMPTYEERLSWSVGDGNGLRVHPMGAFTVGGLNCWENWMPLARTALYAQGEDLHVAVWPGGMHNTEDITRFMAKESRSYVVSVSGLLRREDITSDIPHHQLILDHCQPFLANGGSCVAAPTGKWLLEPQAEREELFIVSVDHREVRRERHNFDPSGHYSRPDVFKLTLNQERQGLLKLNED